MAKRLKLDWYKELGWRANPFQDAVLKPLTYFYVGYEKEREQINYFIIEKQAFGTIGADDGMGKSALLSWIRDEMRSYKGRVAVLTGYGSELDSFTFIDRLCKGVMDRPEKYGFLGFYGLKLHRLVDWIMAKLGKPSRDSFYTNIHTGNYDDANKIKVYLQNKLATKTALFLIEEPQDIPAETIEWIKAMYASGIPLQLIVAAKTEDLRGLGRTLGVKDELGVRLKPMAYKEAREMIKRRIAAAGGDDIWPLDDTTLADLWKASEHNPRVFLRQCYDWTVKEALRGKRSKEVMKDPMHMKDTFDMPEAVREAWERGELDEKPGKKKNKAHRDYNIRVKEQGIAPIVMDFSDKKKDPKYKIKEKKRSHTATKTKRRRR